MPNIANKKLLMALREGDHNAAFDAGQTLLRQKSMPIVEVIHILHHAAGEHNRLEAAYAISWMYGRYPRYHRTLAAAALLAALENAAQPESVRAQALEGFALQYPKRGTKLWLRIERAVVAALEEESVEVRFWACYAAGSLRLKSALLRLQEIVAHDTAICPGWWRVSEEAEDAIEWIHGRAGKTRVPISIEAEL